MFNISKPAPNRLNIEFSGKLDSNDMTAVLDRFIELSEGVEAGRMLYRIGTFDLPTFGAMVVELKRLPALLRIVRRFDKVAVLAEQGWLKKASEIEGALIPGLEIKAFAPAAEAEAEAWLAS